MRPRQWQLNHFSRISCHRRPSFTGFATIAPVIRHGHSKSFLEEVGGADSTAEPAGRDQIAKRASFLLQHLTEGGKAAFGDRGEERRVLELAKAEVDEAARDAKVPRHVAWRDRRAVVFVDERKRAVDKPCGRGVPFGARERCPVPSRGARR